MSPDQPVQTDTRFTAYPDQGRFPTGGSWILGIVTSTAVSQLIDFRSVVDDTATYGSLNSMGESAYTSGEIHFSVFLQPPARRCSLKLEIFHAGQRSWLCIFSGEVQGADTVAVAPESKFVRGMEWQILHNLRSKQSQPATTWKKLRRETQLIPRSHASEILPKPPFYGNLEEPGEKVRLNHGMLSVNGWLAHESENIRRIVAYVDPHFPSVLRHGGARDDVESAFPSLRNAQHSHFSGEVFVPIGQPQPWGITVFVEIEGGKYHSVFSRRIWAPPFNPDVPGDLPPYSFGTFVRAAWSAYNRTSWRGSWTNFRSAHHLYLEYAPPRTSASPIQYYEGALLPAQNRPVSVVIVNDNFILGGAALFAFEYAEFLKNLGWNVCLASPEDGPLRARCAVAGLAVEIVDISRLENARTPAEMERQLESIAKGVTWNNVDLVIANTLVSYWAGNLAAILRKPFVLYVHESARSAALFTPIQIGFARQAMAEATRTVFLTEWTREYHKHSEDRGNFRLMRSWVKTGQIDAYIAANPKGLLREAHGISPNEIIVVCLGSICDRKGQRVLVQAMAYWRKVYEQTIKVPVRILLVGARATPDVEQIKNDIEAHGLGELISLIEETPHPQTYLRMADIYACPSFEEGFPRALMEAAVFGLQIVTTTVCGIPEMLRDDDAWLLPAGDPRALATALDAAMKAHLAGDLRRPASARKRVVDRFNANRVFPQHAALIREALSDAA